MHVLLAGPIALFVACNCANAQQSLPHARKAVEIIQQLRAIALPNSDELEAGPPAKVPGLLRQLNQELKSLIIADLNDGTKHAVPDEEEILDQLRTAGWDEIPSNKWNAYGEIRRITFGFRLGYEPGILIVSSQLWLPCGGSDPDSAVYVFQGIARKWKLVLSTDSDFDPAGESDGSGLQYSISPPDPQGKWFLAIAQLPPSCRRTSTVLRLKILRPGATADKPEVVMTQRERINPEFQPPFQLDTESDWFALTEGKTRKLDGEPGVSILRYEINGNHARRIAPLGLAPEDFLDQWIQLSWDDASRWTKTPSDSALRNWHSQLSSLTTDSAEIESTQPCRTGAGNEDETWAIALSIDQAPNPNVRENCVFVKVARRSGAFYVDAIRNAPFSECPGRTAHNLLTNLTLPAWHQSVRY